MAQTPVEVAVGGCVCGFSGGPVSTDTAASIGVAIWVVPPPKPWYGHGVGQCAVDGARGAGWRLGRWTRTKGQLENQGIGGWQSGRRTPITEEKHWGKHARDKILKLGGCRPMLPPPF